MPRRACPTAALLKRRSRCGRRLGAAVAGRRRGRARSAHAENEPIAARWRFQVRAAVSLHAVVAARLTSADGHHRERRPRAERQAQAVQRLPVGTRGRRDQARQERADGGAQEDARVVVGRDLGGAPFEEGPFGRVVGELGRPQELPARLARAAEAEQQVGADARAAGGSSAARGRRSGCRPGRAPPAGRAPCRAPRPG